MFPRPLRPSRAKIPRLRPLEISQDPSSSFQDPSSSSRDPSRTSQDSFKILSSSFSFFYQMKTVLQREAFFPIRRTSGVLGVGIQQICLPIFFFLSSSENSIKNSFIFSELVYFYLLSFKKHYPKLKIIFIKFSSH